MKEQSKKDQEMLKKAHELYTKLVRLRGTVNNKGRNSLITSLRIRSIKNRLTKVDSYFRLCIAELKNEALQKAKETGVFFFDPHVVHFEFLFQHFEYLKGDAGITRLCSTIRTAANELKYSNLTSYEIGTLRQYAISRGFMSFSVRNLKPDISFAGAKAHIDRFVQLAEESYNSAIKARII